MKTTKSIAFGFYNGLGDIISDLPIIDSFLKRGFIVEVFVYEWLKSFTTFLIPDAKVLSIKETKDIKDLSISSEEFFLTPNYIHKFSYSKTSTLSYFIKKQLLKTKVKKVIASKNLDLFYYAFDIKKTYLDKHFFDMSLDLIKSYHGEIDTTKTTKKTKLQKLFLFPFSGREDKDYSQENFLKVLKLFSDLKVTIFVQEKDKNKLKKEFFEFDVESLSLEEITQLMDQNTLVIANDSGPAHLCAYKGGSVISFYITTEPKKYLPRGNGEIVALKVANKDEFEEKVLLSVKSKLNIT